MDIDSIIKINILYILEPKILYQHIYMYFDIITNKTDPIPFVMNRYLFKLPELKRSIRVHVTDQEKIEKVFIFSDEPEWCKENITINTSRCFLERGGKNLLFLCINAPLFCSPREHAKSRLHLVIKNNQLDGAYLDILNRISH